MCVYVCVSIYTNIYENIYALINDNINCFYIVLFIIYINRALCDACIVLFAMVI